MMDIAALALSGIAILVSIVVAINQARVQARLASIEQARHEEEVQDRNSARLRVQLEPLDLARAVASVRNDGRSGASNVRIDAIHPATLGRQPPRVLNPEDFPLPFLRPSESVDIRLDYSQGNTDHTCDLSLLWRDGRGECGDSFRLRHPRRY